MNTVYAVTTHFLNVPYGRSVVSPVLSETENGARCHANIIANTIVETLNAQSVAETAGVLYQLAHEDEALRVYFCSASGSTTAVAEVSVNSFSLQTAN